MKKHYIGAVYDLTQKNMQNLIEQLDAARVELAKVVQREASLIEATKRELCKHEPRTDANGVGMTICRLCGVELTATWSEKK